MFNIKARTILIEATEQIKARLVKLFIGYTPPIVKLSSLQDVKV